MPPRWTPSSFDCTNSRRRWRKEIDIWCNKLVWMLQTIAGAKKENLFGSHWRKAAAITLIQGGVEMLRVKLNLMHEMKTMREHSRVLFKMDSMIFICDWFISLSRRRESKRSEVNLQLNLFPCKMSAWRFPTSVVSVWWMRTPQLYRSLFDPTSNLSVEMILITRLALIYRLRNVDNRN